ncbi:hypothetical protein PIB30_011744 [Stylosanthes scabra]|uniref:Uncharacterized protein n=1 Tax=Stylosanthes scabra TaxID=79078 RepID=A0ABU6Z2J1_9FABA|nr:hypothetical protein [Stylosanthes scabra]
MDQRKTMCELQQIWARLSGGDVEQRRNNRPQRVGELPMTRIARIEAATSETAAGLRRRRCRPEEDLKKGAGAESEKKRDGVESEVGRRLGFLVAAWGKKEAEEF